MQEYLFPWSPFPLRHIQGHHWTLLECALGNAAKREREKESQDGVNVIFFFGLQNT